MTANIIKMCNSIATCCFPNHLLKLELEDVDLRETERDRERDRGRGAETFRQRIHSPITVYTHVMIMMKITEP